MKSGSVNLLESSGPLQGCNGVAVRFVFSYFILNISTIILSVGQITYRYYQYWMLCWKQWNEVSVVQFQVLSRRGRKNTKDTFTSAGLRAEKSLPDSPSVNSLTSQFSSQVRAAVISHFWHRTVASGTQTCHSVTLLLLWHVHMCRVTWPVCVSFSMLRQPTDAVSRVPACAT